MQNACFACMDANDKPATLTITVFFWHASICKQIETRGGNDVECRKSLYIYDTGKVTFKSARICTWGGAEKVANRERGLRDPAIAEQRQLRKAKAKDEATDRANSRTVPEAVGRG